MTKGKLSLFPNLLGKGARRSHFFTPALQEAVGHIDGLVAESMTGALAFLKMFQTKKAPHHTPICVFNKKTPDEDIDFVLQPLLEAEHWGYISDAGLPCLADPGSKLVHRAYQLGLEVEAFYGPSSLVLGIMLSGLPAQHFSFHGYLPASKEPRDKQLKEIERRSQKEKSLQVFIEAPYRNVALMQSLTEVLEKDTALCVACDLELPTQQVLTQKVKKWQRTEDSFHKRPAIFLIDYHALRK